jgi:ubiquinone biosynthesis protein
MSERLCWRGALRHLQQEAPYWSAMLPQLPRLLHQALAQQASGQAAEHSAALVRERRRQNRLLALIAALLGVIAALLVFLRD